MNDTNDSTRPKPGFNRQSRQPRGGYRGGNRGGFSNPSSAGFNHNGRAPSRGAGFGHYDGFGEPGEKIGANRQQNPAREEKIPLLTKNDVVSSASSTGCFLNAFFG